jgi:hypothetical protein
MSRRGCVSSGVCSSNPIVRRTAEDEGRGHSVSPLNSGTGRVEYLLQHEIAGATGVVEFAAWLLVIAVIRGDPRLTVERIRPVRISETGGQHKHARLARHLSWRAETALAINSQQARKWISSRIVNRAPLVARIDVEIGSRKLIKRG